MLVMVLEKPKLFIRPVRLSGSRETFGLRRRTTSMGGSLLLEVSGNGSNQTVPPSEMKYSSLNKADLYQSGKLLNTNGKVYFTDETLIKDIELEQKNTTLNKGTFTLMNN